MSRYTKVLDDLCTIPWRPPKLPYFLFLYLLVISTVSPSSMFSSLVSPDGFFLKMVFKLVYPTARLVKKPLADLGLPLSISAVFCSSFNLFTSSLVSKCSLFSSSVISVIFFCLFSNFFINYYLFVLPYLMFYNIF